MTRICRTSVLLAAFLVPAANATAEVATRFAGPFAIDADGDKQAFDRVSHRHDGRFIQLDFAFITRAESSDRPMLPRDGETWTIAIRSLALGRTLVETRIRYDAAADCLRNRAGEALACGLYPESGAEQHHLMVRYGTECLAQGMHRIDVEFSDGNRPEGAPYRFVGTGPPPGSDCGTSGGKWCMERVGGRGNGEPAAAPPDAWVTVRMNGAGSRCRGQSIDAS